jgi:hypothetical protein
MELMGLVDPPDSDKAIRQATMWPPIFLTGRTSLPVRLHCRVPNAYPAIQCMAHPALQVASLYLSTTSCKLRHACPGHPSTFRRLLT